MTDQQTLGFQTEVNQLLQLVIHSLYSNKEIFLRELISNASDACDKLRFEALANSALYENDSALKITVAVDKEKKQLIVTDNGIGMNREEIIENLGTIAKSGTKAFLEKLTGDQAKDAHLIGQFGVGFYSAFIIADKVTVRSRRAGLDKEEGVQWESTGTGAFTVETVRKLERGTEITLHLKEGAENFLEPWTLRSIIHKYSDHIPVPIMMIKEVFETEEDKNKKDDKEIKIPEWETINRATALWRLAKNEIKDEDYKEFYKHIAHDFEDPLLWSHNRVEGKQEYVSLLYIPKRAPFDLWNRDKPRGLKLYVQRVFIMDDAEQFLPMYLRFVKGVVDSNDLPLNVSREILQSNPLIDKMKQALTKRILDMLEKLAETDKENYQLFWDNFGSVLKEGPIEDLQNKEAIAKLFRFSSTHTDDAKQTVSLEDYLARMKPGQDKIYFVTAETFSAAKYSPHLEIFRKKNIEVLLLSDRVDEWLISHLSEYKGKHLQSVAKGQLDLGDLADKQDQEAQKKQESEFESFLKRVKEALGEQVKEVKITHRLTDSPACVVADFYDMSGHMQRILKASGQAMPTSKPILELNPTHPLILKLRDESSEDRFKEWATILLDQAILAEGGQLEEPGVFVKRLNKMLLTLAE